MVVFVVVSVVVCVVVVLMIVRRLTQHHRDKPSDAQPPERTHQQKGEQP